MGKIHKTATTRHEATIVSFDTIREWTNRRVADQACAVPVHQAAHRVCSNPSPSRAACSSRVLPSIMAVPSRGSLSLDPGPESLR